MIMVDTGANRRGSEEQAGGVTQGGITGTPRKGQGIRRQVIVQVEDVIRNQVTSRWTEVPRAGRGGVCIEGWVGVGASG